MCQASSSAVLGDPVGTVVALIERDRFDNSPSGAMLGLEGRRDDCVQQECCLFRLYRLHSRRYLDASIAMRRSRWRRTQLAIFSSVFDCVLASATDATTA